MDSLFCGKATGRRTCHRHVRLGGPFEPILKLKMSNPRLKDPQAIGSLPKRGPRKAALRLCGERSRSEMSERRIKKPPQAIGSLRRRGGGGWIRTIEGKASRFTVCPLWPLGYSSLFSWAEEGWSWWTDSNPRPADYKSAALPAELHQHRSFPRYSGAYYNSRKRACQPFFKKNFKRRGDGPTRRYGILNPRGSRGAPCARGSSTPATPILSWTAGRCASTAWAGMPGGTSPGSCAGWAGRRGTSRSTVF